MAFPTRLTRSALPKGEHLVRAVVCSARCASDDFYTTLDQEIARYPGDRVLPILAHAALPGGWLETRSTVAPANTTTAGWAADLAAGEVVEFLSSLGGMSAARTVFERGILVDFGRGAAVTVPGITASAGNTSFVQPGEAIPTRQLDTSGGATFTPKKLATLLVLTREILEHSSADVLVRDALSRSVALKTDEVLSAQRAVRK
jgi:hypothetical protein